MNVEEAGAKTAHAIADNPRVRECCKEAGALKTTQTAADKFVSVCRYCGARHIRWLLESGQINLQPFG